MTGRWLPLVLTTFMLQSCAVVTVASTAVSVTASAVGVAADAAVGTVKIVGKGVGKAADAVLGDDDKARPAADATQKTEAP